VVEGVEELKRYKAKTVGRSKRSTLNAQRPTLNDEEE
jgi:hypothetical protein